MLVERVAVDVARVAVGALVVRVVLAVERVALVDLVGLVDLVAVAVVALEGAAVAVTLVAVALDAVALVAVVLDAVAAGLADPVERVTCVVLRISRAFVIPVLRCVNERSGCAVAKSLRLTFRRISW